MRKFCYACTLLHSKWFSLIFFIFFILRFCRTWKMVRWCIRLTRFTLACEVIRYHLVQVWQNLKKKKLFGLAARNRLSLSLPLSFSSSPYFLSFSKRKSIQSHSPYRMLIENFASHFLFSTESVLLVRFFVIFSPFLCTLCPGVYRWHTVHRLGGPSWSGGFPWLHSRGYGHHDVRIALEEIDGVTWWCQGEVGSEVLHVYFKSWHKCNISFCRPAFSHTLSLSFSLSLSLSLFLSFSLSLSLSPLFLVQVFPGHGAGSPCGKGLSDDLWSTIGRERLTNPALQIADVCGVCVRACMRACVWCVCEREREREREREEREALSHCGLELSGTPS